MWSRKELKTKAKAAFRANRWRCVLVAIILVSMAAAAGAGAGAAGSSAGNTAYNTANNTSFTPPENFNAMVTGGDPDIPPLPEEFAQLIQVPEAQEKIPTVVIIIALVLVLLLIVVAIVVDALLWNPLEVGCKRFFLENQEKTGAEEKAKLTEVVFGYENSYLNVVKTIFLRDLRLFFWFLLLVIPGLIKSYSYRMVPYILADHPDMKAGDVIRLSRKLMDGNKWKSFVLDLSFFGWWLLALITFGLTAVFFSNPYEYATNAELYRALRDSAEAEKL